MIKITIQDESVDIDIVATDDELRILKSIADELCGNCKEGAE